MHSYPSQYNEINGIFFPKVAGDLDAFAYSDGEEFEKRIEAIVASAADRSLFSSELRSAIWDWRSGCHLSPVRANILRPIEKICSGRVLELGAGCGIITRYLGELDSDVVALEGSASRANIARLRTADLENVRVVCDRIEDFNASVKFDVVTMIGVLQYARLFSRAGHQAELSLIQNAARQLDTDGVLVIAIQNRLGLKYFAGYPEPNVDLPFFGIEGRYGPNSIIRFGLDELQEILAAAGLPYQAVLLPIPDYHMPTTILSDKALRRGSNFSVAPFLSTGAGRDRARSDWRRPTFSLEKAWESVDTAGLTLGLSNAFLIIAGKSERSVAFHQEAKELVWHYSVDRHPSFAMVKRFSVEDGKISIDRSRVSSDDPPGTSFLSHNVEEENYVKGRLWWAELVDIVNRPGWRVDEIGEWSRVWINELCVAGGWPRLSSFPRLDRAFPGELFDLTPLNCIQSFDGTFTFIDREWKICSPLQLSYLIIRGLFGSMVSISSCAQPAAETPVNIISLIKMAALSIGLDLTDDNVSDFIRQEERIQGIINRGSEDKIDSSWELYVKTVSLDCREDDMAEALHLRSKLGAAQERLDLLEKQMENQLSSLSWRVTRPLRGVVRLVRKVARLDKPT